LSSKCNVLISIPGTVRKTGQRERQKERDREREREREKQRQRQRDDRKKWKKNEIMSFVGKWMELEITLSEIN
jgi:hypothetical protein